MSSGPSAAVFHRISSFFFPQDERQLSCARKDFSFKRLRHRHNSCWSRKRGRCTYTCRSRFSIIANEILSRRHKRLDLRAALENTGERGVVLLKPRVKSNNTVDRTTEDSANDNAISRSTGLHELSPLLIFRFLDLRSSITRV